MTQPNPMLHIIANRFTLTEFLLESLPAERRERVLMHPRRIKGAGYSLCKLLDAWLPFRLPGFRPFPADYLQALEAIAPDAPVLVFGIENLKDLRIVRKYLRSRRIAIFTWNPVIDHSQTRWIRHLHIAQLKRLGRVFTFDPGDASRHGLTLVDQVYRRVDSLRAPVPQDIDIYFLGKDKGRFAQLEALGARWRRLGLRTLLQVIEEPDESHPASEAVALRREALAYRENIALIHRARCLLELTQANQTGLTIRCLEALFFDRKLITNNPAVRALALYHPARFFVLGEAGVDGADGSDGSTAPDDAERLLAFLAAPLPPPDEAALAAYAFDRWVLQFETAALSAG